MSLDLISITPNLATEIKQNEIKAKIIGRLTELKLIDPKYKLSTDVLLLVCNLLEHLVNNGASLKDKKINKKQLLIDLFIEVYSAAGTDLIQIESQLEFLHSNGAIKRLSRFYLFCCSAYELFFKSKAKKG